MKRVLVPMLLASAVLLVPQTYAQSCCEPTVKDFPKVGGNLGNQNYSSLAQVNKGNIAELGGPGTTTSKVARQRSSNRPRPLP
jgi:alcohol dehydrogenase (cytochrome c)